jgi:tRNA A58 N-methylase Trm61
MTVNRNTESLEEVEEDIEDIQEEASEEEEAHKVLLHVGQQMRVIQHDLDSLRKSGLLKTPTGNGHGKSQIRRAHA